MDKFYCSFHEAYQKIVAHFKKLAVIEHFMKWAISKLGVTHQLEFSNKFY